MDQPAATAFAMRAFGLAQMFSLFVGAPPLVAIDGRPLPVELTTPNGLSTGGGTQNLQHITITYADRTIVLGSFDQLTGVFEVRSFEYLGARYGERWKAQLPLARQGYDELMRRLQALATSQQIALTVKDPPLSPEGRASRPTTMQLQAPATVEKAPGGRWILPLLIGLVVGAVAVLTVVYVR